MRKSNIIFIVVFALVIALAVAIFVAYNDKLRECREKGGQPTPVHGGSQGGFVCVDSDGRIIRI